MKFGINKEKMNTTERIELHNYENKQTNQKPLEKTKQKRKQ